MATSRMRRVNGVVREVLSSAISSELQDPRIGFVTVTAVDTSPDLRHARVLVSVLGSEQDRVDTLAALRSSHGVLQGAINSELRLKRTPALRFEYDDSVERADRITRMLDAIDDPEQDDQAAEAEPGYDADEDADDGGKRQGDEL